jgi:hypothetical protein
MFEKKHESSDSSESEVEVSSYESEDESVEI